ncbi:hypothetical protein EYC84_010140 [Monilinia fructicola]|uniref:Uncharacterized protein n=1 Tax=Monilinia fructicola TaxID=38448 RepID=A0A5M9JIY7_MONFR|nr:hypothetical protein EYC84_010140 [Monilinia fructicola]
MEMKIEWMETDMKMTMTLAMKIGKVAAIIQFYYYDHLVLFLPNIATSTSTSTKVIGSSTTTTTTTITTIIITITTTTTATITTMT